MTQPLNNESSPKEVWSIINTGAPCQIIDVREPLEYATAHIASSKLLPLASLASTYTSIDKETPIYLLCRTGNRARQAAKQLSDLNFAKVSVIKGGIDNWIKEGCPVQRGKGNVWSLERQVRFTAGFLVLTGMALAYTVNANWICLSAFVALGMMFSAVTDTCGMATVLTKMPWNQTVNKQCAK